MENCCYLCGKKNLKLITAHNWPIKECRDCGLIQAFPLPSQKQVLLLYRGNYYRNYGPYGSQEKAHRYYFRQKMKQIKQSVNSGKLLDIGCSLGALLEEAEEAGYDASGIDISGYAVNYCRKKNLIAKKNIITDVKNYQKYSVITAFEIIEHERNPLASCQKIFSLLKQTGLFVCSVPDSNTLTKRLMGKYWFGFRNKEHLFHFNKQTLSVLLKKAGFRNISVKTDHGRPYQFLYYLERVNFYLLKSPYLDKLITHLKKIPIIDKIDLPFNPWGNLIAFAEK